MNASTRTISTDEALRLLADRRRREVLRYLHTHGEGEVTVDELAAAITDGEPSPGRRDRAAADRTAVELHHAHLPKLADAAVVDYDARESIVRYRSCALVERLLQSVPEPSE